jgi:dTDP-4-dehydrorhamnose 3,5-epimerase-like enzyme|tara:strand:- start:4092 stop:4544 length:453 start_codon:yes stop_codon:yes gene_type:complete
MNDIIQESIFECSISGLKIIRPDLNLDTVRDGRGFISTYFPQESIKEFNIVYFHAGMVRGMHYHPHFVEYSLIAAGEGVFVYRTDADDPATEKSLILSKGMCLRTPKGVVHTIYSITELTVVASLSNRWDDSDPPIVQVGEVPKPVNINV